MTRSAEPPAPRGVRLVIETTSSQRTVPVHCRYAGRQRGIGKADVDVWDALVPPDIDGARLVEVVADLLPPHSAVRVRLSPTREVIAHPGWTEDTLT